ncbi:unnamed protein product [Phytophthora fragariaefolia]|uniref:Unnamed protein product n=1 Tax=Phytophthora fragariaefolia TaxID=1490495 RepID=A0A9W6X2P2_9STRA|nr:unnamed protein product [Phytophthora fragariaefolia]
MVSLPCSVSLRSPLVEVAAGPRFPDAPPFESAEELDEFFQQASPKSAPTDSATSPGEGLSTPPRTPRSIFRRRLDEKPFPSVESPPKLSLDAPVMHPVSPASPIGSPTEVPSPGGSPVSSVAWGDIYSPLSTPSPSPPRASVPPGFRPDGLLEAGVPPLPKPSSVQAKPAASSPIRHPASPPSTSPSAPRSASPAGSRPNLIAELWDFLRRWEAEREAEDRTRTQLTAYGLMRPALSTAFALRRDFLRARSFGDMLDVLRANTAETPGSTKEPAELRVQNAKLTRDNQGLLRRLKSALDNSTPFEHDLATVVRERDEWKRHTTKTSELVASFRNTVCVFELQLRESTRQANRRVDSRHKVASSYFEQVQEAAAVISSGGADRALRFANQTTAESFSARRMSSGIMAGSPVSSPQAALASVVSSPAQEVPEITLRVSDPVAPSSAPVSLPLSSAATTSNSSAAGLAMTPANFDVPSAEPRRVPGSPFRRNPLTPVTRPSVLVSASSPVPRSGSAASAAPVTSSAGLVSSMVVTSAPESTARPLPAISAGSASSAPPPTRRTSPQTTKASAESTSKSARKPLTKAAAGSSRRAPRNSAASLSSTSTVAPASSVTGSARSQRASALNARATNSLELQALEASDAEVMGWSSGAANSAARATSASSPLVVDSPSPPVVTPTPAPVETSSSQRQSSSDDSADDEVALRRPRRLRKKSVVESDESSDSAPRSEASVFAGDSSFGQEGVCKCLRHVVKPAGSGRQVCEQSSSDTKSSKAAKSATKTARGTAKSGKSAKSADPTTPASGQSASASGTAAVPAPTSSASSGQASNSAGAQPHSQMCCASLS